MRQPGISALVVGFAIVAVLYTIWSNPSNPALGESFDSADVQSAPASIIEPTRRSASNPFSRKANPENPEKRIPELMKLTKNGSAYAAGQMFWFSSQFEESRIRTNAIHYLERARDEGNLEVFLTIALAHAGATNGAHTKDPVSSFAHFYASSTLRYELKKDRDLRGAYSTYPKLREFDEARLQLVSEYIRKPEMLVAPYQHEVAHEHARDLIEAQVYPIGRKHMSGRMTTPRRSELDSLRLQSCCNNDVMS
jgi:hypothetical protein